MDISKAPINIWPMDVNKFIKDNFIGEVTSLLIFEPSSTRFHPDGLYSETIFGQIGSTDRISRLGYINLHTDIIVPLVYKNLIDVVPWYENILKGVQYSVFDPDQGSFIQTSKDTELADTGFLFFMKYFPYLKFEHNKSIKRTDKIRTIDKAISTKTYKTDKMLICPAGWRDVRIDSHGNIEVEDVNKLYSSLIALSNEMNIPLSSPAIISFFNNIRVNIQLKVNELFQYFKNMAEGKSGFNQEKYAKRYVAWGTRNVITAAQLTAASPESVDYLKYNETLQPLFQMAIAFMPLVIYQLNTLFISQIYSFGSIKVSAIDKETLNVTYIEVSPADVTEALSSESKSKFIQNFKNLEIRQDPVTVKDINGKEYYLWLVYDLGDTIYLFRNMNDLEKLLNDEDIEDGDIPIRIEDCPELTPENTNPRWFNILRKYKELLNIDLSYMQLKYSKEPYYTNGEIAKDMNPLDSAGSWTSKNFIVINPDCRLVFKHYGIDTSTLNKFWKRIEMVLAHELAHEIYKNYKDIKEVQDIEKQAELDKDFTTEYLNSEWIKNKPEAYKEEKFCEYLATKITDSKLNKYKVDVSKIHPLTNIEMLYIATFEATRHRYTTITRYPAIELGSTYPSKPVIGSTSPSRVVTFKSQYDQLQKLTYPHYPIYGSNIYLDSTVIHPCMTAGLNADYDIS